MARALTVVKLLLICFGFVLVLCQGTWLILADSPHALSEHLIQEDLEPCLRVLYAPRRYWTAAGTRKGAVLTGCALSASSNTRARSSVRAGSI